MTNPCDETCPKCGGKDIYRVYVAKGETLKSDEHDKPPHPKYMAKAVGWQMWYAIKEFIAMKCRTCQFKWQSLPLKKPQKLASAAG